MSNECNDPAPPPKGPDQWRGDIDVVSTGKIRGPALVAWAAFASIMAGVMHGLGVREHLNEWWGYGLFFLLAAASQFIYGLVLIVQPWRYDRTGGIIDGNRRARYYYLAGIIANCTIITLYVATRTVGIPFLGPAAGQVEAVSAIGVLTKMIEAVLVVALALLVRRAREPISRQWISSQSQSERGN